MSELTKRQQEMTRDQIRRKTTALVTRLTGFALGETDSQGNVIQMSREQVSTGLGLLKKVVPDMQYVEHVEEPEIMSLEEVNKLMKAEVQRLAREEPEVLKDYLAEAMTGPVINAPGTDTSH